MAYTTINKSTVHFNAKLYTGNASAGRSITGVGFKPDLVWNKIRSASGNHHWYDAVRGTQKFIRSNDTTTEGTNGGTDGITAFGTDGYTIGGNTGVNTNNGTFASWNWKANGQGSSNTAGSINTAYTSANTTAGFSICKWTGSGSNATIGHGLGAVPKIIILKNLNATQPWWTYSEALGAGKQLRLSDTDAVGNDGGVIWNSTAPTSSVFSVGTNTGSNGSSNNIIAYCFAEKQGFSKFGSYTGNGVNNNGAFFYLGFKPAFVIIKRTDSANDWVMFDNKRDPINEVNESLYANTNAAGQTGTADDDIDFLSNGIKIREDNPGLNASGGSYIYMAFAENPFTSSAGTPVTAR